MNVYQIDRSINFQIIYMIVDHVWELNVVMRTESTVIFTILDIIP